MSQTSDPTGLWQQYQIDTSNLGGNGCPCFGDQPRLGMDQNNLYVSTDEFSINGPQFNGGQLYAIAKQDLLAGATAHFVHFADLSSGGEPGPGRRAGHHDRRLRRRVLHELPRPERAPSTTGSACGR